MYTPYTAPSPHPTNASVASSDSAGEEEMVYVEDRDVFHSKAPEVPFNADRVPALLPTYSEPSGPMEGEEAKPLVELKVHNRWPLVVFTAYKDLSKEPM